VIVHDGRLLLVRRAVAEGALLWQLPAGKAERGESPQQAAVREAFEETGVIVEPIRLLGKRTHPVTGWQMSYTACRLVAGVAHVASAREVAEIAWATRAELPSLVPGGLFARVQEYLNEVLP